MYGAIVWLKPTSQQPTIIGATLDGVAKLYTPM